MFTVKKRQEVLALLKEEFASVKLETESVSILNADGRTLSQPIIAKENIPEFRRSTVDGYAVKAEDTIGCSDSLPAFLKLIGETKMGENTDLNLNTYETVYVPTGGIVPEGADAVVMIEYTEVFGEEIAVNKPISNLENIVGIGDDVRFGETVINQHEKINTQQIGVLAALGCEQIEVFKKPRISIISTGDELVPIGKPIKLGQIRDVNTYSLRAMVENMGCEVVQYTHIKDDFDLIKNSVDAACKESDIVFISGGSSVGQADMTPEIINSIGEPGVLVHGIAIKPGKPTIVARVNNTAIFGLPGHPASCIIAYKTVVEPFIQSNLLNQEKEKHSLHASSDFQVHVSSGRDVFYMVSLVKSDRGYLAQPVHGKSGMITLLSNSDGYIEIPMEKEGLKLGETVEVHLF